MNTDRLRLTNGTNLLKSKENLISFYFCKRYYEDQASVIFFLSFLLFIYNECSFDSEQLF